MNNKGFMRYEVITILLLIIVLFCAGGYYILNATNKQRINTMSTSGKRLSDVVLVNIAAFRNINTIYLEEVINEELLENIKNPFEKGICDITESRVDIIDGNPYTTLRCGNYLIDKENIKIINETKIYKISDWSTKKIIGDNVERKTFYNCKKDGKNLYEGYLEEGYLISKINADYDSSYYFVEDLKDFCDEIVGKVFYRTKDEYK